MKLNSAHAGNSGSPLGFGPREEEARQAGRGCLRIWAAVGTSGPGPTRAKEAGLGFAGSTLAWVEATAEYDGARADAGGRG